MRAMPASHCVEQDERMDYSLLRSRLRYRSTSARKPGWITVVEFISSTMNSAGNPTVDHAARGQPVAVVARRSRRSRRTRRSRLGVPRAGLPLSLCRWTHLRKVFIGRDRPECMAIPSDVAGGVQIDALWKVPPSLKQYVTRSFYSFVGTAVILDPKEYYEIQFDPSGTGLWQRIERRGRCRIRRKTAMPSSHCVAGWTRVVGSPAAARDGAAPRADLRSAGARARVQLGDVHAVSGGMGLPPAPTYVFGRRGSVSWYSLSSSTWRPAGGGVRSTCSRRALAFAARGV